MLKQFAGLLLALVLSLGLPACGEKKQSEAEIKAAKEKAWRERQRQQAIKYYGELIKNHPDSPHVAEAKQRLEALGPAATPAKK